MINLDTIKEYSMKKRKVKMVFFNIKVLRTCNSKTVVISKNSNIQVIDNLTSVHLLF